MKTKLIITEAQYERLKEKINEETAHASIVRQMREDLDKNYEPIEKYVREGGEYFEKSMVKVKADEEEITPKALFEFLKYKYKQNDDFTKQVIRDWMFGNITDDNCLSKHVAL